MRPIFSVMGVFAAAWGEAEGRKRVILEYMATGELDDPLVVCPLCGLEMPESQLQPCSICRSLCCQYCALLDYGRTFCSSRCRGFFMWGDGEPDEKDF